ncbi:MFS transporter [Couchioplanes caeruleus]|uniref:MFS transporter n=1 Tax=Couchioplanes caeruleus TaxID=56438 RepID=UPI0020BDC900|nr:MFS transporter [Couchioplanes caeruleus]UQU67446.1 MFS transporter [Couchioplanes caeruleus]
MYAIIEAPGRGWSDPLVVSALAAAGVLLTAFVTLELRIAQPMIDLRLFARPQFLWASVAGVLVTFGLLGMLFVLPQYLQLVKGHDAFDTGLRLLPLIGGLVIGAPTGERLAARTRYRIPVTAGLLILAAGLTIGARTDLDTGYGYTAAWMATVGLGIGLALSPAMDAVLGALPPERAGAGTAITMTLRQIGGALGVALLGSLLAQGYTNRLDVTGLPADAANTARESIAAGLAVAARLGDPALATAAKIAYLQGMTIVLYTTAAIAILSAALTAALLPGRPTAGDGAAPEPADPAPAAPLPGGRDSTEPPRHDQDHPRPSR